jgi:hypothetical protein
MYRAYMVFLDEMKRKFPHLYPMSVPAHTQTQPLNEVAVLNQPAQPPGIPPQPAPGEIPPGVKQIADTLNNFLPVIENLTGLSRREIALQLLKTGIKGGSISSVLEGLMGQKPAPEAKFIRYVKIFAVWVPAFVFLMGGALVGAFVLYKLALLLVGSL